VSDPYHPGPETFLHLPEAAFEQGESRRQFAEDLVRNLEDSEVRDLARRLIEAAICSLKSHDLTELAEVVSRYTAAMEERDDTGFARRKEETPEVVDAFRKAMEAAPVVSEERPRIYADDEVEPD